MASDGTEPSEGTTRQSARSAVRRTWDEGNRIVADVTQYDAPPRFPRADGRPSCAAETRARLVRRTLDPDAGTNAFTRTGPDDLVGEFPRIDDRRAGLTNRIGACAASSREESGLDTIAWLDLRSGYRATYALPPGDSPSEPVFVARGPDALEGDGWLLAVAWRGEERRSDLLILDTADVARGPVATVRLAHRVPFGFHGNWVADDA